METASDVYRRSTVSDVGFFGSFMLSARMIENEEFSEQCER